MARLPQPGGDGGNWGNILNDYLSVTHAADGSLKTDSVGAGQIKTGAVTEASLSSSVQAKLNATPTIPVTSVAGKTNDVILNKSDVGLSNVDNTSDANKPISTAVQAALDGKQVAGAYATTADLTTSVTTAIAEADLVSKSQLRGLVNALNPLSATYFADAFAAPPANDMPTITWTQSSATTIPGGSTVGYNVTRTAGAGTPADVQNDPVFRFDGMLSLPADSADPNNYVRTPLLPGGSGQAARYLLRFGVVTSSTQYVEFRLRALATSVKFRIIVNGKWVTEQLDARTATTGSPYQLLLTFPSAAVRTVWVEIDGGDASLGQARVTSGASLTKAPAPTLRVAVVGDSYVGGSGSPADGARRLETSLRFVAHLMGADSFFNFGIGGTGWVSGTGSGSNYGTRLADVVACNPQIVIVLGSRNDGSDPGVEAAATAGLAVLSSIPNVYVTGPSTSGYTSVNAQVQAAAVANGRPFFDGVAGAWITAADLGTDGVHPTYTGHKKIADGFWRAARPWILTRGL